MLEALLRLTLVMAGGLLLVWALLVCGAARMLLRPPRMTDGRALALLGRLSPADLNIAFEEITFTVKDERGRPLQLAGWWMPSADSPKCAVLLHGYADAKVGAIAWASLFLDAGWNVLAVDLRAHGASGGERQTGGFFERHDISQVIDQVKCDRPDACRSIVLFGVSLGAATAAAVASLRPDIAALILEGPFASFPRSARIFGRLAGVPATLVQAPALWLAEKITGAHFDEVAPIRTLPRVNCPVLIIEGANDPLNPPEEVERLRQAIAGRPDTAFWIVPGAGHVLGYAAEPAEYRRRITDLLARLPADDPSPAGAVPPGGSCR